MLHVRMLSGEDVAIIPVAQLSDVKALKQQLHRQHCMPPRFRQRLLLDHSPLADSTELDSPMDLELVLLTHSTPSLAQAKELATAARNGSTSEEQGEN